MNKRAKQFLLQAVARNYENIAFDFDQSRQRPMKPLVHEISKSLNLPAGARVLDLGCGNACFLPVLSLYQKDFFYLGIDGSVNLVELAKKNQGDHFKILNILDLDKLAEKDFDIIFSWAVLHHIPGKDLRQEVLEKVFAKLQDRGRFVFSVWKFSTLAHKKKLSFMKIFLEQLFHGRLIDRGDFIFPWKGSAQNDLDRVRYYHNFSKKELDRIIAKTSFSVEKFMEDDFNYYYILKK
jgi:SAM-dependent methyltransferase